MLAAAAALAGCGGTNVFSADAGWFSRPMDFGKPDWNLFSSNPSELKSKQPVGTDDLVGTDGTCAPAPEPPPAATPPATAARAGESAGKGQTAATASAAPSEPPPDRLEPGPAGPGQLGGFPAGGGVALGMTECQVVRRAGQPQTVTIGAAASGERTAVVTYVAGNWPGIYHFEGGRLKEIDQAPQAAAPEKPQKGKKKKRTPAKTAGAGERVYVQ
ncbi:MAG TPA: hypothetical protein VFL51_18630 [Pseudolabrys sp.]|nr:hypothetical protein [Pseudolabrys sp.]